VNNSQLIDKAGAMCSCMSYDDKTPNGSPKAMIKELCQRLGSRTVSITKKRDGYLMTSLYGESRYLTKTETLMWRLFKWPPKGMQLIES